MFSAAQAVTCGQLSTVTLHAVDRYGNAHVSGGAEVAAQLRGGPSRGVPSTVKARPAFPPRPRGQPSHAPSFRITDSSIRVAHPTAHHQNSVGHARNAYISLELLRVCIHES